MRIYFNGGLVSDVEYGDGSANATIYTKADVRNKRTTTIMIMALVALE